jgi:hypothetical protein
MWIKEIYDVMGEKGPEEGQLMKRETDNAKSDDVQ